MSRHILRPAALFGLLGLSSAAGCPYANPAAALQARDDSASDDYLAQYTVDDSSGYMTDDVGGQISDQNSLKAGSRGPTLLEDFIFRQK
jgi:catalase